MNLTTHIEVAISAIQENISLGIDKMLKITKRIQAYCPSRNFVRRNLMTINSICLFSTTVNEKANLDCFEGSCHCGNVGYNFYTSKPFDQWPLRQCQCTFCRKHNATMTSDNTGHCELFIKDKSMISEYQFGFKTAIFYICKQCGCFTQAATNNKKHTVINIYMLKNLKQYKDLIDNQASPSVFTEETSDQRDQRRAKNWTPLKVIDHDV